MEELYDPTRKPEQPILEVETDPRLALPGWLVFWG